MNNKVDSSLFDEELEKLRELINQLASSGTEIKAPIVPSGPSISSKELQDIREALKKIAEHEDKLKGWSDLLKRVQKLEEEMS